MGVAAKAVYARAAVDLTDRCDRMRAADRMLALLSAMRAGLDSRCVAGRLRRTRPNGLLYGCTARQAGDPEDSVVAWRRHPPDATCTLHSDVRVLVRAARERPAMTEVWS